MPVVDGFQATHIIQHELKSSCPIVAMTANAMVGVIHCSKHSI